MRWSSKEKSLFKELDVVFRDVRSGPGWGPLLVLLMGCGRNGKLLKWCRPTERDRGERRRSPLIDGYKKDQAGSLAAWVFEKKLTRRGLRLRL